MYDIELAAVRKKTNTNEDCCDPKGELLIWRVVKKTRPSLLDSWTLGLSLFINSNNSAQTQ